jgi:hypothetical protein
MIVSSLLLPSKKDGVQQDQNTGAGTARYNLVERCTTRAAPDSGGKKKSGAIRKI